jgi:hypothetical protein
MADQAAKDEASERVGVLLVHGIGEQNAFEHLEQTAIQMVAALEQVAPNSVVSVDMPRRGRPARMALRANDPHDGSPAVIIEVKSETGRLTRIDLHEVWWADLDEPDGVLGAIEFWLWGLGQWLARPYWRKSQENIRDRDMPIFPWERRGALAVRLVRGYNRAKLFLVGGFFFILVGTWSLAKQILSLFKNRAPSPTILVRYIGDVKLYQQRGYRTGGPLPDQDQPPRVAIMRRMVNAVLGMALADYDRWYVWAHSLGSAVAWDGLNQAPHALANYLPKDAKEACLKAGVLREIGSGEEAFDPASGVQPARPHWIAADETVDRRRLFEKLAGLCTYGSPIDKFAFLWPRIIAQYKNAEGLDGDFEWVNVYDPTDPVAGAIDSFQTAEDGRAMLADGSKAGARLWPANYAYRACPLLLVSHIRYLIAKKDQPGGLIDRLAEWTLKGGRFEATATDADPAKDKASRLWLAEGRDRAAIRRRLMSQRCQWLAAGVFLTAAFSAVLNPVLSWLLGPIGSAAKGIDLAAKSSRDVFQIARDGLDAAGDRLNRFVDWTGVGGLLGERGHALLQAIADALPYALALALSTLLLAGVTLRIAEHIVDRRRKSARPPRDGASPSAPEAAASKGGDDVSKAA